MENNNSTDKNKESYYRYHVAPIFVSVPSLPTTIDVNIKLFKLIILINDQNGSFSPDMDTLQQTLYSQGRGYIFILLFLNS